MSKLTLHVDDELIAAAKEEAVSRRTSVSKLVSDFFRVLSATRSSKPDMSLPPITSSLRGCLRGSKADLEDYIDHLEKKHS